MGEPAVANPSAPITMTLGESSKSSLFTMPSPKAFAGTPLYPIVNTAGLLGGLTFTASLVTVKVTLQGEPVVLVGAEVVDADNYSGTVTTAQGAGAKFDMA